MEFIRMLISITTSVWHDNQSVPVVHIRVHINDTL